MTGGADSPTAELSERFEILEPYPGGEGDTARVRSRADGSDAVLKVLDAGHRPMEATLLASLAHPAIPRIREVGTTADGRAFLVRDFVAGEPLSRLLPLDRSQALELATQILEVLAYVHLRGVLHLDLKPGNILRSEDGRYHLLDFGLGGRTGERSRGGTPFFAAPEVLLGLAPDARSDLFSLGAVLVAALWPGKKGPPLSRFLQSFPAQDYFTACGVEASSFPSPFDAFLPSLLARRPPRRFGDAQAALEFLSGGSGRPQLTLLQPDPILLHGEALAEAEARLAPGQDLVIRGGAAEDRRLLALHCACSAEGREVRLESDHAIVRRNGGEERLDWELPELATGQVQAHLQSSLGLEGPAARAAADWLITRGVTSAVGLGERLSALAEQGVIVPHGARWIWPDAASGRLEREALPTPAADAGNIQEAARRGRAELAQSLFRRAAAGAAPEVERDLRRALARGFLAAGEPRRALPLCHDLPVERVQALFDLGRTTEAEAVLTTAEQSADDAESQRRVQRVAAQLAFARGEHDRALGVMRTLSGTPGPPEERITLAVALEGVGREEEGGQLLRELLPELDKDREPFLRAAALTDLALIERRLGNLDESRRLHGEARDLLFSTGHARHAATAVLNLGVLEKDLGLLPQAVDHLRQSRTLYQHVRDRTGAAIAEANLGIVELESGDAAAAEKRLQQAADTLHRLGSRRAESLARVMLARAQAEQGKADVARASLVEAGGLDTARLRQEAALVRSILSHPKKPPARTPATAEDREQEAAEAHGISRELFRTFLAVNRRLASESELERAMDYLLDAAMTLSGGRRGYLLLARPDGLRLEFQVGESGGAGQAFSRSLANRAMQEQRTLTGEDALADRELAEMPSIRNLKVRSAVCAPFHSATGATGAIYVEHAGRAGVFGPREKEQLEMLADQAAIAADRMLRDEQLAAELQQSRRELAVAQRAARREPTRLIGESRPMRELRVQIEKLAQLDLSILILGETGTGKELVARAIHESGPRRRGPFVAENCSALPAELMERELFGHVQGAFTGADQDRPGLLELAHDGTLFLDEVGDMPAALQAKLLRALQEQAIRRVGGSEMVRLDLRLLAATHKDLKAMVASKDFREDLYYRIAAVELHVPALRDRKGDVIVLANHFLERFNRQHHTKRSLGPQAHRELEEYDWPGNVRELEHVIARACLLTEGDEVQGLQLPQAAAPTAGPQRSGATGEWPVMTLQEAEQRTIQAALASTGGDKSKAARILGISRTALYEKLKRMAENG